MDRSGISPFPTGPYIEGLAGKLDRKPTIALFRQVDKRGSRVEDDRDQYDPDRQFCAQLLCLFLARERNPGAEQSIGADELDKLYHDNTVFPADGPSARRFAMVLEHTTQVFIHTLLKNVSAKFNLTSPFPTSPIQTASKFRKKFKKLDIIATVFLIQDLTHLPNMKLALPFYRTLAHHLSAEQEVGAGGKSTSGPTIARYYAEWRKTIPDHSRPNSLFDSIPNIENIGHSPTLGLDLQLRFGAGRSKCFPRSCQAAVRITGSYPP